MKLKSFGAALLFGALSFASLPAALGSASGGGGGGGGGVAAPCGTLTAFSSSNVTLSAGTGGYTASPLAVRGSLFNCSIYLQSYYVSFTEPNRPTSGGLNGPVVTCTADFMIFNINYISSGSSTSFSGSGNITPTAVTDPSTCRGTHTLLASLQSRTDGRVLSTWTVNYTVL